MSKNWPMVKLKEIVTPAVRAEAPSPGTNYRQIGVRLWGEGSYERETMDGAQTKYTQLFRAEAGDLIVNKIWARNGSVAVVPAALAGCYGSGEFPMFTPRSDRLDSGWLHWLTKTRDFWAQCDEKSRGTSGKNRIKPEQFLRIDIPLPPLAKQQQIVARIEELSAKIQEARVLRQQAAEQAGVLWINSLRACFAATEGPTMPLQSVCAEIIDNLHSTPTYNGNEFPCIRSQDVGWGSVNFERALRVGEAEFVERTRRGEPKLGDIVFVREGDVGRCAVVDGEQRFCLGQRVMMFRPAIEIIDSAISNVPAYFTCSSR